MNPAAAQNLQPRIEVACVVCGNRRHDVICTADEVRSHLAYLEPFHRRRLRPAERHRTRAALTERADFTQDYVTNIVACTECRLVFRDPRPDATAIMRAYESDQYGDERLRALFDPQFELFRPKAHYLRRRLGGGPGIVVVELGSFVGGILAAGRECGWRIAGIDPGKEVAAFCEQQGFHVLREAAEEAPLPAASAHCVAIWNTFDQLADPDATLRSVQRLLRPGGMRWEWCGRGGGGRPRRPYNAKSKDCTGEDWSASDPDGSRKAHDELRTVADAPPLALATPKASNGQVLHSFV